ncbi:MAG TPA: DinB family protein [Acidobacteriota bacterium]|nr:DinB family protein [Acidobacteriota bacterium]
MEITAIEPFLDYYAKIRGRTKRVIESIPPEKIEWSPGRGRWSFGDLIRHLANIERWMYAENVRGHPSRYAGHGAEFASGYGEVLDYFDELHAQSVEIFSALSPRQLQSKCLTPAGLPITTWKWLRAMVEHEIHHRGQFFVYLGLLGIPTRPIYGMTSEQVFENSQPPRSEDK